MTTPYPITELFVWVVDDPTSRHAVMAVKFVGDMPMQAVSSTLRRMQRPEILEIAELTARETGLPVRLQRFVLAETLMEVKG